MISYCIITDFGRTHRASEKTRNETVVFLMLNKVLCYLTFLISPVIQSLSNWKGISDNSYILQVRVQYKKVVAYLPPYDTNMAAMV